jgi:hypothetical protein
MILTNKIQVYNKMKLKLFILLIVILALTTAYIYSARNRIETIEIYDGDEKTTFLFDKFKETNSKKFQEKEMYYTTDDLNFKITDNFLVVTSHKTEYYFSSKRFYITYK